MRENLMVGSLRTTSKEYAEGYDVIRKECCGKPMGEICICERCPDCGGWCQFDYCKGCLEAE